MTLERFDMGTLQRGTGLHGNIPEGYNPTKMIYGTPGHSIGDGKEGGNTAVQKMVAEGIGSVGNLASTVTSGLLNKRENDRARAEARELADIEHGDNQEQQGISNRFQQRMFQQEQRSFEMKQKKEEYELRYSRWMDQFKKQLEMDQSFHENIKKVSDHIKTMRVRSDVSRQMFK